MTRPGTHRTPGQARRKLAAPTVAMLCSPRERRWTGRVPAEPERGRVLSARAEVDRTPRNAWPCRRCALRASGGGPRITTRTPLARARQSASWQSPFGANENRNSQLTDVLPNVRTVVWCYESSRPVLWLRPLRTMSPRRPRPAMAATVPSPPTGKRPCLAAPDIAEAVERRTRAMRELGRCAFPEPETAPTAMEPARARRRGFVRADSVPPRSAASTRSRRDPSRSWRFTVERLQARDPVSPRSSLLCFVSRRRTNRFLRWRGRPGDLHQSPDERDADPDHVLPRLREDS